MRETLIAAAIVGVAIVGAAAVVRLDRQPVRYEIMKSGYQNTMWMMDRKDGSVWYCGAFNEGLDCAEVPKTTRADQIRNAQAANAAAAASAAPAEEPVFDPKTAVEVKPSEPAQKPTAEEFLGKEP